MQRFSGKRVLVTGSGRGIGAAIARRFALEGAHVYLTARSQEELSATSDELRSFTPEVRFTALDLTEPDAAAKLATDVEQSWGGLDILVTNAGAAPQGGFLELKDEDWAAGFGLKLFANLRLIKSIWPMLKAVRGHLVMIGGGTARTPERPSRTGFRHQWWYCGSVQVNRRARASGLRSCQPGPARHDQDLTPQETDG